MRRARARDRGQGPGRVGRLRPQGHQHEGGHLLGREAVGGHGQRGHLLVQGPAPGVQGLHAGQDRGGARGSVGRGAGPRPGSDGVGARARGAVGVRARGAVGIQDILSIQFPPSAVIIKHNNEKPKRFMRFLNGLDTQ